VSDTFVAVDCDTGDYLYVSWPDPPGEQNFPPCGICSSPDHATAGHTPANAMTLADRLRSYLHAVLDPQGTPDP
jgi:hypothetical protein